MNLLNVITKEDQEYNHQTEMTRLNRTTTLEGIGKIAQGVYQDCKANFHYMTKEQKDTFWKDYNTKRESLRAEPAAFAKELLEREIPRFNTRAELQQVRSQIFDIISLSKEEKEHYRKVCNTRINELAA